MSKSSMIRELYEQGKPVAEIASIVGCKPEYVRVVVRQRNGGQSKSDRARNQRIYALGDRDAARLVSREAYRVERAAGASHRSAQASRAKAWMKTMRRTAAEVMA